VGAVPPVGRILLVPQGARLIGRYNTAVAFGQRRALIVWQRIVFPDGRSLRLDNVPATDPAGYAGLEDKVDFHTWPLLEGAAVSTLLGIGANLTFGSESDLVQGSADLPSGTFRAGAISRPRSICGSHRRSPFGPESRCALSSTAISSLPHPQNEEMTMPEPTLPDRTPVKLTVVITPDLRQALNDYAEAYREAYDQAETATDLVPIALQASLDADRGFAKARHAVQEP
jgi:hypothetical protein